MHSVLMSYKARVKIIHAETKDASNESFDNVLTKYRAFKVEYSKNIKLSLNLNLISND